MSLLREAEVDTVAAVARLLDCNPFLPQRVELERRILGPAFVDGGPIWHAGSDDVAPSPNTALLHERFEQLAETLKSRLIAGARPTTTEAEAYRNLALYLLWLRFEDDLWALIEPAEGSEFNAPQAVAWYERFEREAGELLAPLPGPPADIPHLFAIGYQFRRAFHFIFRRIYGGSLPAARLRASVWQAIFTVDQAVYRDHLYEQMWEVPVMITGETGTGKDLVAGAIGLSHFIPFDDRTKHFAANPHASYIPVNLSERATSVLESELFGHARGAFTGADRGHEGWFVRCGPHGVVFLDEIGEVDKSIQIKLLRVLQNRTITPIGEKEPQTFRGRLLAATNRDIDAEVDAGRFREDFYFRICADTVELPTLREQLAESPHDLARLVAIVARRVAGNAAAPALAERVCTYIDKHLRSHSWPGNMRELELCVKRVMTRGEYRPRTMAPSKAAPSSRTEELSQRIVDADITVAELERRYVHYLSSKLSNVTEIARVTGRDPRTISRILGAGGKNGSSAAA